MKKTLKTIAGYQRTRARMIEGKLILSLPDAQNPTLWQMDLAQTHTSSFEVATDDNAKCYWLLSHKDGENEPKKLASFKDEDAALSALAEIAQALDSAQGHMRGELSDDELKALMRAHKKGRLGRWIIAILGLALVIILLGLWSTQTADFIPVENTATAPAQPGVPLSAEDFLRAR